MVKPHDSASGYIHTLHMGINQDSHPFSAYMHMSLLWGITPVGTHPLLPHQGPDLPVPHGLRTAAQPSVILLRPDFSAA